MTEMPAVGKLLFGGKTLIQEKVFWAYIYYLTAPIDASEMVVEKMFSVSEHITKGKKGGKSPENITATTMQNLWSKGHFWDDEDTVVQNEKLIQEELDRLCGIKFTKN